MSETGGKTSIGMEPNVAGLLCYLFGWVSGLIIFIMEKENKFVRFHAMQSIIVFGGLSVIHFILMFIPFSFTLWMLASIIGWLLWILTLVLWIILMIQAYQGKKFKLPIAGDFAEKQAG